jgi:hypothetical protein
MEDEMTRSRVLASTTALALVLATAAPAASFARGGFGGGGGHMGGGFGGGHAAFGGGGHMGGGFGGAHFAGVPGGGARFAAAPAAHFGAVGPAWSGARVAAGNWHGGNWHGGHFHHGRFFPGFAAGVVAGAALGSYAYYDDPYYYYGDNGYYTDNGYYDDGTAVVVPGGGGDASYCAQRYRSWDPASGTYLGNDGLRHPCP